MGRRSHTRHLGIWMNGARVATWSVSPAAPDTLSYEPAWVASALGRPLSLSLPFVPGNRAHQGPQVRAFFENLLPDSRNIRERMATRFNTGSTDAFRLLEQVGRDCVGAIEILPETESSQGLRPPVYEILDEAAVARLLRHTVEPMFMGQNADPQDFRMSVAGAQEKTALLYHEGHWCRPLGNTPSTHILKLPMGLVGGTQAIDMRQSVENEWLCSKVLAAYGLPVAACEPVQFEDQTVLAVERFDRAWRMLDSGKAAIVRLPQEDMCQAFGVSPDTRYERDGGPGMDRILDLLNGSDHCEPDQRVFFKAQLLFWMLCATDGHAKNFSLFLRPGGRYQLTPLYDVLSVLPLLGEGPGLLSPHQVKMAMAVRSPNAHSKMKEIHRRHWQALGQRHGVVTEAGQSVDALIESVVMQTDAVVQTVLSQLPAGFPAQLAERVLSGLSASARRLAQR